MDFENQISQATKTSLADLSYFNGTLNRSMLRSLFFRAVKRVLDYVVAIIVGVLVLPVLVVIVFISIAVQGWSPFYISKRCIKPNKAINVFKLRAMVKDANSDKYKLHERFMRNGYLDIPTDCEVYTPLGRFLESYQLVELPQVYNIIFNGMSWVGNRPLPQRNNDLLKEYYGWQGRYDAPCGLTGISQVVGKLNLQPEERLLLERLYSYVYANGNILKCDFRIILATINLVLFDKTIDYKTSIKLLQSCME
jgi:lipopolysaccharide/colanic/teichoic acid biosynthesis glycosyltransferase